MTGRTRWWWRLPLVCGVNVVGVVLLTEALWIVTSGEPYMSRWIAPKPSLFQFERTGAWLAMIAIGVPTMLGLSLNYWLMRHPFRRSLTEGLKRVWSGLQLWRYGWWWRSVVTVLVVFGLALAYASFSRTDPIAHATGTLVNAWLTPPVATQPATFTLPFAPVPTAAPPTAGLARLLQSSQTTTGVRPLVERSYEIILIVFGAALALMVFRILCVRGVPRDGLLRCLRCNHVLHGLTEPRCPECGEAI